MESLIFKLHLLFSLYMLGLIWFVQLVHYPLFAEVGSGRFVAYEQQHTRRTSWVTAPIMLLELGTAVLLVYYHQRTGFYWLNLAGVTLLWLSTFFIQVPLHNRLIRVYDAGAIKKLVQTNWIRTVIWTVRAVGLIYII